MSKYSKQIWDYFMDSNKIGNAFGVAGLMGNLEAESAHLPNNLQNSCESRLNTTDEQYTKEVDSGTYKYHANNGKYKIYRDGVHVSTITYDPNNTRDSFSYDRAGYGLAQWTHYGRKQKLYDRYKNNPDKYSSIGCIELALDFLWYELTNSFKSTLEVLKNATTVEQASDYVLDNFEKPAERHYEDRRNRSKKYYNSYVATASNYTFVARTKTPAGSKYDPARKYYTCTVDGGLNKCIKIYSHDSDNNGLTALPNCVGYAWGRAHEILGEEHTPELSTSNANLWYEYNDGYDRSSNVPKLGAILCWDGGGCGHVAVVETINYNNDGSVKSLGISWGGYYHPKNKNGNEECKCTVFKYDAEVPCENGIPKSGAGGGTGKSYTFQGYIYLPISKSAGGTYDSTDYDYDSSTTDSVIDDSIEELIIQPVGEIIIKSKDEGSNLETSQFLVEVKGVPIDIELDEPVSVSAEDTENSEETEIPEIKIVEYGYRVFIISNGKILGYKDSNIKNNFKFHPNDFIKNAKVNHGENLQIGISVWAKTNTGITLWDNTEGEYPICSNSVCLKLFSEMSDILYLNNNKNLRRVQPYLGVHPAKIFKI